MSRINLDEWGNLGPMTQSSRSEINYTGKKMDQNTGLFYFNQRYYDPELGRFITHDPAEQGLNPYAYSGNSPLMYVDPDGEWFFALIAAVLMEGAKAAVINTGAQWALNGFDSRNINWNSVGDSFLSGGVSGGLGFNGGIVKPGGGDVFSYMVAGGINGGITNVAVNWALGKGGDKWGDFQYGFGVGGLSGVGKWWYKEFVGFDATMKSGKGVMGKDLEDRQPGELARKDALMIGNDYTKPANNLFEKIVYDIIPGREGGIVSNFVNFFPGTNSFAALHDTMSGKWAIDIPFSGDIWSAALFAPAFLGNYWSLHAEHSFIY